MSLSNMQVFNQFVMPATLEILAQRIDAFNAASAGAIVLSAEGMTGSFMQESFFASLSAARRRVDRNAANSAAPVVDLEELKKSSVKVAGGFGPVRYEPSQMTWLLRPTQEGIAAASESFAELLLQDQLNTAISCAVGAIGNVPALVNDVSGAPGAPITYSAINTAHAGFGDQSSSLVTNVMTGSMAHKLIGQNLSNVERLFVAQNVRVIDLFGQTSVITDAPALTGSGVDHVLSLCPAGVVVGGAQDIITNVDTTNGNQRIETTFQSDYSFTVGVKGFSWDEANGGSSPDDTALATGSNWDKVTGFDKFTAGVLTIGDQ